MYQTFFDMRPIRVCVRCGSKFRQKPMTTGRFCRPRCWYDYRQIQAARRVIACMTCNGPIDPTDGIRKRRKFCSRACADKGLIKNRSALPPPPVEGAMWLPLTRGQFALVDADMFDLLAARPWIYSPKHAPTHGRMDGSPKLLHRFITGVNDPAIKVDHKSGNSLDNRRQNLRTATHAQNLYNSRKKSNAKSSKYKGVHFSKAQAGPKKWHAMIRAPGRSRWLGGFETQEEAAKAYDAAAREAFGEFACVNFPLKGERCAISVALAPPAL